MKVLVINSGSSSIKYQLFEMTEKKVLASGLLEQIGEGASHLKHLTLRQNGEMEKLELKASVADHAEGFDRIFDTFRVYRCTQRL